VLYLLLTATPGYAESSPKQDLLQVARHQSTEGVN